jgi:hypothetical protein
MKTKKQQEAAKHSKNGKAATTKTRKPVSELKTGKDAKAAVERKRTIRQLVIETLAANSAVTNAELIGAVKAEFPESAFKDTHAAWYRSQARKGLLTGAPIAIPAMSRKQSPPVN